MEEHEDQESAERAVDHPCGDSPAMVGITPNAYSCFGFVLWSTPRVCTLSAADEDGAPAPPAVGQRAEGAP